MAPTLDVPVLFNFVLDALLRLELLRFEVFEGC